MDSVVVKRVVRGHADYGRWHPSQNKETPAPGSAEVREAIFRWLSSITLLASCPPFRPDPRLANSIRRAFPSADQARLHSTFRVSEQRAAMKAEELAARDTAERERTSERQLGLRRGAPRAGKHERLAGRVHFPREQSRARNHRHPTNSRGGLVFGKAQ